MSWGNTGKYKTFSVLIETDVRKVHKDKDIITISY